MTKEVQNTDRELYTEQGDDYWSDGIWLVSPKEGRPRICIKVRGHAITMTLRDWHACALRERERQNASSMGRGCK